MTTPARSYNPPSAARRCSSMKGFQSSIGSYDVVRKLPKVSRMMKELGSGLLDLRLNNNTRKISTARERELALNGSASTVRSSYLR